MYRRRIMKMTKMAKMAFAMAATIAFAIGMSACTGLLTSADFGYDDYGPGYGYYWPSYGGGWYNPPTGLYAPAWGATPPPPPSVGNNTARPQQPNGANRPNYAPTTQPSQNRPATTPAIAPNGQQRPGNMGQGPVQTGQHQESGSSAGASGTHRGR